MAIRLKELREQHHLSHNNLSAALEKKYGIPISKDSLIAYEAEAMGHSRFGSNLKMKVEFLVCLADFYDVSTDYLLMRTNEPKSIPSTRDQTGLSKIAMTFLQASKDPTGQPLDPTLAVNGLFETAHGRQLLEDLNKCIYAHVAQLAYDDLSNEELRAVPHNKGLDPIGPERYDCVARYLSVRKFGTAVADSLLFIRNTKYSHTNPNINLATLHEYTATTNLSKHCDTLAKIIWKQFKKTLATHYKFQD